MKELFTIPTYIYIFTTRLLRFAQGCPTKYLMKYEEWHSVNTLANCQCSLVARK